MRVLFYRDCRSLNRIQIAKATAEGTIISDPYTVRFIISLSSALCIAPYSPFGTLREWNVL